MLDKLELMNCRNDVNCDKIVLDDFLDFDSNVLNNIANLNDEETKYHVFKKIVNYLAEKIISDLMIELTKFNITLKEEQKCCNIGEYSDTFTYLPKSNLYRGIFIETINPVYNSPLTKILIKNVAISVNKPNPKAKLKIIDGVNVFTKDVALLAGRNDVSVNYIAQTNDVYVLLDGNNTPNDSYIDLTSGCGCNYCGQICGDNLNIVGFDGSQKVNKTFGLFLEVCHVCDWSAFFCGEIDNMKLLIQEAFMQYTYEKSALSDRMNMDTFDKNQLYEKAKYFNDKYKSSLLSYTLMLSNRIKKYDIECLYCNTPGKIGSNFN